VSTTCPAGSRCVTEPKLFLANHPANPQRGTGEGGYGWDLKPDSTMPNGAVSEAVKSFLMAS
jgi:hypothetical protein